MQNLPVTFQTKKTIDCFSTFLNLYIGKYNKIV